MSHLLNLFVMLRVSVLRLSEKVTIISFINISKLIQEFATVYVRYFSGLIYGSRI